MNKHRIAIYIFIFYILFFCKSICCKEFYLNDKNRETDFIYPSIFDSPIKEEEYKEDDFHDKVINKNISIGRSQREFLHESEVYIFNFVNNTYESDLLINFYPLDCKIKIAALNDAENDIIIQTISNYEYDAFSILIKEDKINSSYIKIKPLINILKENNKKRAYHLVINSFYKDNSQLELKEKEPTLIYFDSSLETIKLSYRYNTEPVVFSFFIKERAKFEAKIMNDEDTKRIIAYKDNIIVNPNTISNDNDSIYLTIDKKDKKNSTLIVRVSGNSIYPYYLQKNILNLGFMPINISFHYYYMEVFKGERLEIMANSKINGGFLMGTFITKEYANEVDILNGKNYYYFINAKQYSYFTYNTFTKCLDVISYQLENCQNGCYLLITYYTQKIYLKNIDGIEYSLLTRIWEQEEIKPQIVNIPLNEYIFGTPSYYYNNYHYYSLYIPEGDNITIEFQGRNVQGFLKHGIIKINPFLGNAFYFKPNSSDFDLEDEKLIITIDKRSLNIQNLENQYISFVFFTIDNFYNTLKNYYYIRIIQDNSNNHIIYPLDTNKANICRATSIGTTNVCYFLMKNDYNEFNYNFIIHAYGKDEANYKVWSINDKDADYYSIDLKNITKYESQTKNKGLSPISFKSDTKFILIEIESNFPEILNVFFNFNNELIPFPSLDIYSYQIFYLKDKTQIDYTLDYFNPYYSNLYALVMNNTSGEGHIYFNNLSEKKIYISNENILSFSISNDFQNFHIFSEIDLLFYLKIKNKLFNEASEELYYGSGMNKQREIKAYYIKDINGKGIDINFNLEYDIDISYYYYFIINGHSLSFDTIKYINKDYINNNLVGKLYYEGFRSFFDPKVKSGLIFFDEQENEIDKKDNYFLFFYYFSDKGYHPIDYDISSEIFIESKNSEKILIKNKYIRGCFNLLKNDTIQYNTYIIQIQKEEEKMNKTYLLEFSSNFEDIEVVTDSFKYDKQRINMGVQQFLISGKEFTADKKYSFKIKVNKSNLINYNYKIPLDYANYIIKFSDYEMEDHQDFFMEKKLQLNIIRNKSKDSIIYNFTINLDKTYTNINNYNYSYFFTIIGKKNLFDGELLNTTAIITYNLYNLYYVPFLNVYETNEINRDYSFLAQLDASDDYFIQIFVIINASNGEESYYSTCIDLTEDKKDDKLEENNRTLKIVIIAISSVFGVFLLLFIFIIIKFTKKNKNLKTKIEAISFSSGIEADSLDKACNNDSESKKDEDYDNTFI